VFWQERRSTMNKHASDSYLVLGLGVTFSIARLLMMVGRVV
jgi:hypothetical protein